MLEIAPKNISVETKGNRIGIPFRFRERLAKFPRIVKNDFLRRLRLAFGRIAVSADPLREERKGEPVERAELLGDRALNPNGRVVVEPFSFRRVEARYGIEKSEHSGRFQVVGADPPAEGRGQAPTDVGGRPFGVTPNKGNVTLGEPIAQLEIVPACGVPPPEFVDRFFDGFPLGKVDSFSPEAERASGAVFPSAGGRVFPPGEPKGSPGENAVSPLSEKALRNPAGSKAKNKEKPPRRWSREGFLIRPNKREKKGGGD